jgi:LPXTG-motif cell wall-anchored protein
VLSGGAQIANAIAIGLSIAAAGALLVFVRRGAHG